MWLRVVLLLVLAGAVGFGTVRMAQQWLEQERAANAPRTVVTAPPPQPARSILVAANELQVGHFLRPEDLRWQPWPDGPLAPNYIEQNSRNIASFVGAVVRERVALGEPVTDSMMVRPGDRGFLAAVLGPGMRAIAVPIDERTGVAGMVYPGDRVDVMMTYVFRVLMGYRVVTNNNNNNGGNAAGNNSGSDREPIYEDRVTTETVLLDLRILAIDQNTNQYVDPGVQQQQQQQGQQQGDQPRQARPGRFVTLEVTPQQAEFLTIAQQMMAQRSGSLSLSLRSLADPNQPSVVAALPEGVQLAGDTAAPGQEKFFGATARTARTEQRSYSVDSDFSQLLTPWPTQTPTPPSAPTPSFAPSQTVAAAPTQTAGTVVTGRATPLLRP